MVYYSYEQQVGVAESISALISLNGFANLYAVETSWTEDGTKEYSNIGGDVFLFSSEYSAKGAYQEILSSVAVDDFSIFDISLACYKIEEGQIETPITSESLSEYYAMNVDSDNEIESNRILGKCL